MRRYGQYLLTSTEKSGEGMKESTRLRRAGLALLLFSLAFALYPVFRPFPGAPGTYNTVLVIIGACVVGSALSWPKIERFLRTLPLAARLSLFILFAFVALVDVKADGFTLYTVYALTFGLPLFGILFRGGIVSDS